MSNRKYKKGNHDMASTFKNFVTELPDIKNMVFNITDYGAISGGTVPCTEAIKKAIEEASNSGGGRILVPNGIWLTGPIALKSGIDLHLEDNAVLIFTKSKEDYPLIVTDYEGIKRIRAVSQISAENAENISITGRGIINGNGHLWRPVKQFKMTDRQWKALLKKSEYVIDSKEGGVWVPTKTIYDARFEGEVFPDDYASEEEALEKAKEFFDFYRPVMVSLRHCKKVLLDGIRFQNSAAWNIHPYFCEDLTICNVSVNNPYYAQNGDGIDVDSCNRVHIHHCDLQTGDDGICLKSGKDKEARKLSGPCQNVYIHDCKVGQSHGGFVIGSEMSRGVNNVLVKDCTGIDSDVGIRFKSALGRGGVVENIFMENIQMVNIKSESVIITMDYIHNLMDYNDPVSNSTDPEDIPEFRNIFLKQCISSDPDAYYMIRSLEGHPETVHDIFFEKCKLGSAL
jgi:polygalacturonase